MYHSDDRGQSAPLGVAILLGITLLGTTAIVVYGSVALTDTQDSSELAGAEQSMTLFDSQTAQVALGDAEVQTVDLGQGEGTYTVNETAGSISIVQLDCDDDGDNGADYDNVTDTLGEDDAYILSPRDLGAVVYETDDETIAYQGGGVWRANDDGSSTMLSPPEFHYRGATLTLPVVLTRGNGGASRSAVSEITSGPSEDVFPDSSESFPDPPCWEDGTDEPFENPVNDGRVIVRIESEYADAWGNYFETRTEGVVTKHADDVVTVELVSLGQIGDFEMPGDASSVTVSGASSDHSTQEFTVRLRPDDSDSANFSNLQWSMYVEKGDQRFEMYLKKGSGSNDCSDGSTDLHADLDIYYSPDGGDTYQGWHEDDAFAADCKDFNGDGDDEIYIDADFVDDEDDDGSFVDDDESNDPELEYVDKDGMNNLVHFTISGSDSTPDPYTMDGHSGTWEPEDYNVSNGETETVDRLVNHYFAELPSEFDLTVDDKGSNTVSESDSSGHLTTGGSGRYVTYLHVTTNEVEVEID